MRLRGRESEAWLFLREISFLARRLDYTKGRQGGGSAAASRAKLCQRALIIENVRSEKGIRGVKGIHSR